MTPDELQGWRIRNGYTQVALAQALGVHSMTISKWETGAREIPPFLHLALRCLELEGGEPLQGLGKRKKERKVKRHGSDLPKR